MKIKEGFFKRKIDDEVIVVSVGGATKIFNGMMKLNPTGEVIWDMLEDGVDSQDEIVSALNEKYDGDIEKIKSDVSEFIDKIKDKGII